MHVRGLVPVRHDQRLSGRQLAGACARHSFRLVFCGSPTDAEGVGRPGVPCFLVLFFRWGPFWGAGRLPIGWCIPPPPPLLLNIQFQLLTFVIGTATAFRQLIIFVWKGLHVLPSTDSYSHAMEVSKHQPVSR